MKSLNIAVGLVLFAGLVVGSYRLIGAQRASAQTEETGASPSGFAAMIPDNSGRMLNEGRHTFRFDTFGDEAWWGDTLQLHQAIEGVTFGGVGPGISPATALSLGLKVDLDALPASLVQQLKLGKVNLNDPSVTLALLKLNAVVGVPGIPTLMGGEREFFDDANQSAQARTNHSQNLQRYLRVGQT